MSARGSEARSLQISFRCGVGADSSPATPKQRKTASAGDGAGSRSLFRRRGSKPNAWPRLARDAIVVSIMTMVVSRLPAPGRSESHPASRIAVWKSRKVLQRHHHRPRAQREAERDRRTDQRHDAYGSKPTLTPSTHALSALGRGDDGFEPPLGLTVAVDGQSAGKPLDGNAPA